MTIFLFFFIVLLVIRSVLWKDKIVCQHSSLPVASTLSRVGDFIKPINLFLQIIPAIDMAKQKDLRFRSNVLLDPRNLSKAAWPVVRLGNYSDLWPGIRDSFRMGKLFINRKEAPKEEEINFFGLQLPR